MTGKTLQYILGYLIGGLLFLIGIPYGLYRLSRSFDHLTGFQLIPISGLRLALAVILLLFGLLFAFWSLVVQNTVGQGGPVELVNIEVSPKTQNLVVTGPYRYTRNPMLFGACVFYFAVAIYLNSVIAIAMVALFMTFMLIFVIPTEERRLLKDFGRDYEDYRGRVSMFIPWMQKQPRWSVPARVGWVRDWQHWAPYAAVAWSLVYAALGLYWAVSGRGFPYAPASEENVMGPLVGRLGPAAAWVVVIAAGLPAAAVGAVMLRGVKKPRPLLISAGALLTVVLLLFMTDLTLLITLGYIPYISYSIITGAGYGQGVLHELAQSWLNIAHQLWCLIGGFLWLAASVSYARRSSDACLYCGRREGSEGWTNPKQAARWGRFAVYVGLVAPVLYAATRYAWALGIPWGMTWENWRAGQARGTWTGGLSLATFGLVGALLMLGLVQRWGEAFPRWMVGLAGRRVPIALAMVPASIVSVLLIVGGIAILSGYIQVAGAAAASGDNMAIVVGPTFLFPLWGAALAVATLGYYYRRRGPCGKCGRGAPCPL